MNASTGLALMVTATWVLLLGETYILFGVVRPMYPNIHENAVSAVVKIGAAIVLGAVWVGVMFALRGFYVRRVARPSPMQPTSSPAK
jgi:cytochrome c biogenesis factor